ncbi:3-oxoacyl-ACP synthase III family protein [Xenorhabdus doucetiae]|uniref:3-oxoacyl-[acyl-carrier-protein] synthase n=1 Tax=Xenorhabdus doucetiae TaxID=351671 RepID=A0A068QUC6_9GAMM|nr:ketoacyl-ACP synthase III [Xenorhabdus doucetiae]TYP02237.1 3-oxoacyl-[acyl-carrier-protein] synthase-3 [Xenorhabdus doucetiae]CDG18379.1 3-oxoacyl-[acyl-carrier-protein] synthase [Xenorhabdus doucetiae]
MNVTLRGLKIEAVAASVPLTKLTLAQLAQQFGEAEVARIAISTGISQLGIAHAPLRASDLCVQAACKIFSEQTHPDEIDGVIFVSQTPDYLMPATSCVLQQRLGLCQNVVAFDINYGCSGYIYGLYQAALLISSQSCRKVLLCAGDTITQHIADNDHKLRMVLGDAGSATVIAAGEDEWAFDIHTDGSGYDKLIVPQGEDLRHGYLQMDGAAVMEFALKVVHNSVNKALEMKGWDKQQVDHFVLHQPNRFMLQYLTKKLRVAAEKVPIAVENYGNTGPTSIPLTLCQYFSNSGQQPGTAIMSGFGVGLSWGAVGLSLKDARMFPPLTYTS